MTECFLASVCAIYAVILLFAPNATLESQVTKDITLFWWGYGRLLAIPFALKAVLTGGGLIANINGYAFSKHMRVSGACVGTMIWVWYATKFVLIGDIAFIGFPFVVVSFLMSIRIIGMSLADLPRPGAVGAL